MFAVLCMTRLTVASCLFDCQPECEAAAERVRGVAPTAQGCSSGVRFRAAVLQWGDTAPELARY